MPTELLGRRLDPFVRRVVTCFTLARSQDGSKNLGFGFTGFRSRALLNRFASIMFTRRLVPWSAKQLKVGLARQKTLDEMREHFCPNDAGENSSRDDFGPGGLIYFYSCSFYRSTWGQSQWSQGGRGSSHTPISIVLIVLLLTHLSFIHHGNCMNKV